MTGRVVDMHATSLRPCKSSDSFLYNWTVRAVQVSDFIGTCFTRAMIGMLMAQGQH